MRHMVFRKVSRSHEIDKFNNKNQRLLYYCEVSQMLLREIEFPLNFFSQLTPFFFTLTFKNQKSGKPPSCKQTKKKLEKFIQRFRTEAKKDFYFVFVGESSLATEQRPHFHGILFFECNADLVHFNLKWSLLHGHIDTSGMVDCVFSSVKYLSKGLLTEDNGFTKEDPFPVFVHRSKGLERLQTEDNN